MTSKEAFEQIDEIIERQAAAGGSILSAAWTRKARDLEFYVKNWPTEKALLLICEYGYIQGLSAALYLSGEGVLASADTYEHFLGLWFIVMQEFIAEGAEQYKNGTD